MADRTSSSSPHTGEGGEVGRGYNGGSICKLVGKIYSSEMRMASGNTSKYVEQHHSTSLHDVHAQCDIVEIIYTVSFLSYSFSKSPLIHSCNVSLSLPVQVSGGNKLQDPCPGRPETELEDRKVGPSAGDPPRLQDARDNHRLRQQRGAPRGEDCHW